MTVTTHLGRIYLRFLQLKASIRGLPLVPSLDPLEERILLWIAKESFSHARISVRGMMAQKEFGSPATIHTRLKSMRRKGWIVLADTDDARRKQIELTEFALKYFAQLSDCVLRAVKSE